MEIRDGTAYLGRLDDESPEALRELAQQLREQGVTRLAVEVDERDEQTLHEARLRSGRAHPRRRSRRSRARPRAQAARRVVRLGARADRRPPDRRADRPALRPDPSRQVDRDGDRAAAERLDLGLRRALRPRPVDAAAARARALRRGGRRRDLVRRRGGRRRALPDLRPRPHARRVPLGARVLRPASAGRGRLARREPDARRAAHRRRPARGSLGGRRGPVAGRAAVARRDRREPRSSDAHRGRRARLRAAQASCPTRS